jgi:hypothetical protein
MKRVAELKLSDSKNAKVVCIEQMNMTPVFWLKIYFAYARNIKLYSGYSVGVRWSIVVKTPEYSGVLYVLRLEFSVYLFYSIIRYGATRLTKCDAPKMN